MSNLMLAPAPWFTALNANGATIAGAKLYTLASGGTWPGGALLTYQDSAGLVPNTNPVICDAAGRCALFCLPTSYKFIYCDAADVPIRTVDPVIVPASYVANTDIEGIAGQALAVNDVVYLANGAGGTTAGRWYKALATAAASSSTAGDLGMVPAAIAAGATGAIRLRGRLGGFIGLAPGSAYFVHYLFAGWIVDISPFFRRLVGVADSSTSLVINPTNTEVATIGVGAIALASQAAFDTMYAISTVQWARIANGITGQVFVATTGAGPSWTTNLTLLGVFIAQGYGTHTFGTGVGVDGDQVVKLSNPHTGTAVRAVLNCTAGSVANQLISYGSNNTGGISGIGGEFAVYTAGNGGLSLVASHASGVFRITTGGTTVRFSISETGAVAIVGTTVTIGGKALAFGSNDSFGAGFRTVSIANA